MKREYVAGKLIGPQRLALKVRQQPFSVYLRFLDPPKLRGREVIYVAGRNDNKLLVHLTGARGRLMGTLALKPDRPLAMTENRYPITEVGLVRLVERLIEVGQRDMQRGNCVVRTSRDRVQGRACTSIEVDHPSQEPGFMFHRAVISVDEALNLPIRYEAYGWPDEEDGEPPLIEEYSYVDLKFNNGFTDRDFDPQNPQYSFRKGSAPQTAAAP